MLQRLAIALLVLLALGAAAAVFAPAKAGGSDCGTLVSPKYDHDQVQQLLEQATSSRAEAQSAGIDTSELDASLVSVASAARRCDDTLSTRQTIAWVLLGLAIVLPFAIMFVAGSNRPDPRRPS